MDRSKREWKDKGGEILPIGTGSFTFVIDAVLNDVLIREKIIEKDLLERKISNILYMVLVLV
jgi:hypothetical protein